MDVPINYLGVLVAAIASMAVGFVWYSKPVFGDMWQQLVKLREEDIKKDAAKTIVTAFVMALLAAYVLSHTIVFSQAYLGNDWITTGVSTGFFLWMGISATATITHAAFERRRKKLTLFQVSHDLVNLVVMGLIISLFYR